MVYYEALYLDARDVRVIGVEITSTMEAKIAPMGSITFPVLS